MDADTRTDAQVLLLGATVALLNVVALAENGAGHREIRAEALRGLEGRSEVVWDLSDAPQFASSLPALEAS